MPTPLDAAWAEPHSPSRSSAKLSTIFSAYQFIDAPELDRFRAVEPRFTKKSTWLRPINFIKSIWLILKLGYRLWSNFNPLDKTCVYTQTHVCVFTMNLTMHMNTTRLLVSCSMAHECFINNSWWCTQWSSEKVVFMSVNCFLHTHHRFMCISV